LEITQNHQNRDLSLASPGGLISTARPFIQKPRNW